MDDYEEAILFTYALLESRLDRIDYVLSGGAGDDQEKPKTFPERVQRLERSLQELSNKTALLKDAQDLVSKHADLLKSAKATETDNDAGLSSEQKAALVVERAPAFATMASQLKALEDQPVPETDGFTKLAMLRPRLAQAEERHLRQALEISLLRKESALLVQRKRHIAQAGQSRVLVEYHGRIGESDKAVRRAEFRKKQREEEG